MPGYERQVAASLSGGAIASKLRDGMVTFIAMARIVVLNSAAPQQLFVNGEIAGSDYERSFVGVSPCPLPRPGHQGPHNADDRDLG